jgi:ABC-2 type transport system permease protein
MKLERSNPYISFMLVIVIILIINVIAEYFNFQYDLTDDDRFTISENTKQIVGSMDDNITINVLLEGEFPAGFRRLQSSVKDLILKLRDANSNITFEFEDPTQGNMKDKEQRMIQLRNDNIIPLSLSYSDGTQLVQKPVFPFAIINFKSKKMVINLLEEQKPGDDEDIILNKSIALLEYKFADAFLKLKAGRPKNILFTQGNGEWDESQTFRLESELRRFHKLGRYSLDSMMMIDSTIDLVIVAGPKTQVSLQNQFKLDQYVMQGGKIIWMIDKFPVSLDSINKQKFYIPVESEVGLDDLLFKYGVRLMPDLIMDMECSGIPQVIGMAGDKPQTKLFPWPYHIAALGNNAHPITKNIDRVNLFFPATIDTVKTDGNIKKTILISSSKYSRAQLAPVRLTFEILKTAPDPSKFNDGNRPVAVLLEGEFESFFKNRLTPDFKNILDQLNFKFKEKSLPNAKQLVISDSDFAKNLINTTSGETEDIGFNKWERRYYKGNKDFILNAVEYMLEPDGVLESRSKEIKLRLLDSVRTKQEKLKWQLINVVVPVIIIVLLGFLYQFYRKRKFA